MNAYITASVPTKRLEMFLFKMTWLEMILLNLCLLSAAHQPSIEAPRLNEKATAEFPFISLICL